MSAIIMGLAIFFAMSIVGLYIFGVVYMSRKKQFFIGLALPVLSAGAAIYNYLVPAFVNNPNSTMLEEYTAAFYGVLSVVGFIVFGYTRYRMKNRQR